MKPDSSSPDLVSLQARLTLLDAQRSRLGRLAETMNALSALSMRINTLDAAAIMDLCVKGIPPLVRASQAAFLSHDSGTGTLLLERHTRSELLLNATSFPDRKDPLLAKAAASTEVLLLPGGSIPALGVAKHGLLMAPLRSARSLEGILVLMDREDGLPFDQGHDLAPVQQLAQLLGAALCNIRLYQQVVQQSRTDPLTGLLNRRALTDFLDREIRRCRRYKHPLSLLLVDLDHFKGINDTQGHPEGDRLLRDVGELLLKEVRTVDLVARFGGDEFCLVLPETNPEGARVVARRVVEHLRARPGGQATCSIGVAALTPEGKDGPEALVAAADRALYKAKAAGRDGFAEE